MLASIRLGSERVRKAKTQQLRRDFKDLKFRQGETVEEFALQLQGLASQLATYGKPMEDEDVVFKLLRVVLPKYVPLLLSMETMLDLFTLTLEDAVGRLRTMEDRAPVVIEKTKGGQLLMTEAEWTARQEKWRTEEGPSRGGGAEADKRRVKVPQGKKYTGPNACRRCGKVGHWARVPRS